MRWLALCLVGACGGGFDSQITISPGTAASFSVDGGPAQTADFEIDDTFGSYTAAHQHAYQLLFVLPDGTTTQTMVSPRCGTRNHFDTAVAHYTFSGTLSGSGACSDADGASCHWSTDETSDNC